MQSVEFPEAVVKARFTFARGQCECTTLTCGAGHRFGRCVQRFTYADRATSDKPKGWQADHHIPVLIGGTSTFENCRILCLDCHVSKTLGS